MSSRATNPAKEQKGSGGKRVSLPPGGFAPRGSMTLRRAKAALYLQSAPSIQECANPPEQQIPIYRTKRKMNSYHFK